MDLSVSSPVSLFDMSQFNYRRPGAEMPSDNSDDDLDLDELDPTTSDSFHEPIFFNEPQGSGSRIALRAFRPHPWADTGGSEAHASDLEGLLEDNDEDMKTQRSSLHTDDAPLLRATRRSQRPSPPNRGIISRILSKFDSFKGKSTSTPGSRNETTVRFNEEISREVLLGRSQPTRYPPNIVSNAKYTPWSFLPRTLYNEFSFFFNMYFLCVALSQTIPALRIGYISSYIIPLAFVVSISLGKEAVDDIARRRRDAESNGEEYTVLSLNSIVPRDTNENLPSNVVGSDPELSNWSVEIFEIQKRSRDLRVGDVVKLRKDQRFPADVVILKNISGDTPTLGQGESRLENTTKNTLLDDDNDNQKSTDAEDLKPVSADSISDAFIRTDQLDGETDWKLRLPSPFTQNLPLSEFPRLRITAGPPHPNVHDFVGTITLTPPTSEQHDSHSTSRDATLSTTYSNPQSVPLTVENTAWANTVLASNTFTIGVVIYTGSQTRSAMGTSQSRTKVGLLEYEINSLTKILCALTLSLSIILVALERFQPTNDKKWYIAIMIYLILFSTIIPMSLRVNLDMAKTVYGKFIERDAGIPGTVVRTSTIPEDLGRVEYLLSDKTGTLTQNGE